MFANRLMVLAAVSALSIAAVLVAFGQSSPATTSAPAGAGQADAPAAATMPAPQPTGGDDVAQLTKEQETATLAFLKEHRAAYYDQMQDLKGRDPLRYGQAMRRMYKVMRNWEMMPKVVQEASEVERQTQIRVMDVIRQMRQARTPQEREKLETALTQAVSDHFEAEQNLREFRLQDLDRQVKDLRIELQQQRQHREAIIAEQVSLWLKAAKPVEPSTRPAGDNDS